MKSSMHSFLSALAFACVCVLGCGGRAGEPTAPATGETSEALSSRELEYEYYSDDTYTTLVGYYYRPCTGIGGRTGTTSRYVIGSQTDCRTYGTIGCYQLIDEFYYCGYASCVSCTN